MQAIIKPVVEVVISGHLLSATVDSPWVVMLIVSGLFMSPFFPRTMSRRFIVLKKILPLCRSVILFVGHICLIIVSLEWKA